MINVRWVKRRCSGICKQRLDISCWEICGKTVLLLFIDAQTGNYVKSHSKKNKNKGNPLVVFMLVYIYVCGGGGRITLEIARVVVSVC